MDDKTIDGLYSKILDACDYLEAKGVKSPIRRRDPREPGRRRKEQAEEKIFAATMRYFREQKRLIREIMENNYPDRKADFPPGYGQLESVFQSNDKFKATMARLLSDAILDSILLFGETQKIGIDYTLVNAEAVEWARDWSFKTISDIDDTSRTALQKAISGFAETPGMTIGDVVDRLPYSEQRALTIATTEITRAYAQGNQMAGEEMKKQFPGVKVIKIWFTNNDDRVCDICGPLDGQEVEISENFVHPITKEEYFLPPDPHPLCRCWDTTTTDITAED